MCSISRWEYKGGGYFYFWIRVELFIIYCAFFKVHHYYQSRHGQRAFIFKRYYIPFLITIFCIQGAKAAQKRERNAEKQKGPSKSQAKVNEAAKTIVCSTCKQDFVSFVYPSRCSTTDQSFSIVAYYPCTCVSDLDYLSKPTFTTDALYSSLEEHAANKHSKTMADCFPAYKEPKTKSSSKV